jgi:hypothetical protein
MKGMRAFLIHHPMILQLGEAQLFPLIPLVINPCICTG